MKIDGRKNNKGALGRTWKKKNPIGGKNRAIRMDDDLWNEIKENAGEHTRTWFIKAACKEKISKIKKTNKL